jgi:hypothetical protein
MVCIVAEIIPKRHALLVDGWVTFVDSEAILQEEVQSGYAAASLTLRLHAIACC